MKASSRGIWIGGANSKRLLPWKRLLLPALYPVLFLLFLVLGASHQEPVLEYFVFAYQRSNKLGLDIGTELLVERTRAAFYSALDNVQPPAESELPVFNVFTADSTLEQMVQALKTGDPAKGHDEGGDMPYFSAYLTESNGKAARCKVALRGFGFWHHAPEKPSMRVKVKREDVFYGRRYMEFPRPEDPLSMTNWLSEQLAQKLGVMSQRTEHVGLFFNNRFLGLYDLTYRPGEALALSSGRLPGTFFKGDILGNGMVGDPNRSLWEDGREWKMFGEQDEFAKQRFEEMLQILKTEELKGIEAYLDLDQMARWSAVMSFVGSNHTDKNHNQMFYYDGTYGLFQPVLWDPNGFGLQEVPMERVDILASPLEQKLFARSEWRAKRAAYLRELVESDWAESLLESELKRTLPWLKADPFLSRLQKTPLGVNRLKHFSARDLGALESDLKQWIEQRKNVVSRYLAGQGPAPLERLPDVSAPSSLGPGVVKVDQDRSFRDLEIRPGTTLKLAPGKGIFVSGRFTALGTEAEPITVEGDEWGCFSMTGPLPKRVRYATFRGGSLGTEGGLRYKGMVNAYRCDDAVFENCVFQANRVSDDAFNGAHSRVTVRDCLFESAAFDALDLDMCRGVVEGCNFLKSGNDGLDVMSSRVLVRDCRFVGSGDKGVSCGEQSLVKVEESRFEDCGIGVQSKDDSKLWLSGCVLEKCRVAVSCYRKKWLYPQGGEVMLQDCEVRGPVEIDAVSKAYLLNTRTETVPRNTHVVEAPPQGWQIFQRLLEPE